MYSFTPTDEQQMLLDAVGRYAENDLRPAAREADEAGALPPGLVDKGWELGLLQASVPEDYHGFGEYSAVTGVLVAEKMAYGDLAGAMAVLTPNLFALPILFAGTEEQKSRYLPPVIEAEWKPFTAALMEYRFDFDPRSLETTASPANGGYNLSGEKCYVPFADQAQSILVYANLDGKTQGFIVPGDQPGLEVQERQQVLGIHALPLYSIQLDDVEIPAENRLGGEEGHALTPILAASHAAMTAMAVGVAQAAFEYSRDYAKEREVFGVKVAQKQAIAFMLAEMATDIEGTRLLAWEAAWKIDQKKEDAGKSAYLALQAAIDMVMMVTDRAVQILGGHGYIREHPVEMWMRNGRGFANLTGLAMV